MTAALQTAQQVPYVGLPVGDKLALREVRFDVGEEGAEWVAAWHAQLYILAKQGRTFGAFSTTPRAFVASYGGHVPRAGTDAHAAWLKRCIDLWAALVEHGVIEVDQMPTSETDRLRVVVLDFGETNQPRPSARPRTSEDEKRERDRLRKRAERAAKRAEQKPADSRDVRETSDVSEDASASALPDQTTQTKSAPIGAQAAQVSEDTSLPADPRSTTGQIRRARGQLGDIALLVDGVLSRRREQSTRDLPISRELADFWRVGCELLADHGRERLKAAMGVAAREDASSMEFVRKVCERMQRDEQRRPAPRHLAAVHALSDDDAAALDAVEGAAL